MFHSPGIHELLGYGAQKPHPQHSAVFHVACEITTRVFGQVLERKPTNVGFSEVWLCPTVGPRNGAVLSFLKRVLSLIASVSSSGLTCLHRACLGHTGALLGLQRGLPGAAILQIVHLLSENAVPPPRARPSSHN